DQEVDGASGDSLGAAAIEELRGPFIVVGRDGQVGKRTQRGAQALPRLGLANARQQLLANGTDEVGVPGVHQALPLAQVTPFARIEVVRPSAQRERPDRRVDEDQERRLRCRSGLILGDTPICSLALRGRRLSASDQIGVSTRIKNAACGQRERPDRRVDEDQERRLRCRSGLWSYPSSNGIWPTRSRISRWRRRRTYSRRADVTASFLVRCFPARRACSMRASSRARLVAIGTPP